MKSLNNEICMKCGICAVNCPMGLIKLNDFPEISEEAQILCNKCDHCAAICPEGAIGSSDFELGAAGTIPIITPENMAMYMKSRRSIRNYSDKPIKRETLEEIFEIIRYAPTASNGQPVQWTVINHPKKVHEISARTIAWMKEFSEGNLSLTDKMSFEGMTKAWDQGDDPILRNAPCLVVAHAPSDNRMAFTDGIIALTHLDLTLPSFGMGGCWAGLLNIACNQNSLLKSVMGVPEGNAVIYPFMLGYPKYQYQRIPERNQPEIIWEY